MGCDVWSPSSLLGLPVVGAFSQWRPAEKEPVGQPRPGCQTRGCGSKLLTVIQLAVIHKITQVSEKKKAWSTICTPLCRNERLPASVSRTNHVHLCVLKVRGDGLHVNNRVQFLWSGFDTAVTRGTDATHIPVSVPTVLPCWLQNDNTGTSCDGQQTKRKNMQT